MEEEKYKPTKEMAKAAQKGLDLRKAYKRGGTAVGVARANQLIKRQELPITIVARMYSYFKRHEVDKKASGWKIGEKGYPSAGFVAWLLWGDDVGKEWSTRIWEKYKENKKFTSEIESLYDEESSDELLASIIKIIDSHE